MMIGSRSTPVRSIEGAEKLIGLNFSSVKRDSMLEGLQENLKNFENLRKVSLPNSVAPAILFNPIPAGMKLETSRRAFRTSPTGTVMMPRNLEDLAFYSVAQLSGLLRTRKVTSEQLTKMYLGRLKKYGPKLECVITLTEELALKQAKRADDEIKAGKYRGDLHGIPYGAKDLLAVKGYKTSWGSVPYKDRL
ncbi:MAG TPA: amidase family protein, partial [Bacteroidota bacterium]|nr:amidase family protein [Bacteroidota bacterium]